MKDARIKSLYLSLPITLALTIIAILMHVSGKPMVTEIYSIKLHPEYDQVLTIDYLPLWLIPIAGGLLGFGIRYIKAEWHHGMHAPEDILALSTALMFTIWLMFTIPMTKTINSIDSLATTFMLMCIIAPIFATIRNPSLLRAAIMITLPTTGTMFGCTTFSNTIGMIESLDLTLTTYIVSTIIVIITGSLPIALYTIAELTATKLQLPNFEAPRISV